MSSETKNVCDVALAAISLVGAAVAFVCTLQQWRISQSWKRSEQLDKFVELFEKDELLGLGRTIVDWTVRKVSFRREQVKITNDDVLRALELYSKMGADSGFPGEQPLIRDAFDAWLNFFQRLELALSSGLIDRLPTMQYFQYWVRRFATLEAHPDTNNVLGGRQAVNMVRDYVKEYGDIESFARLCRHFQIAWSPEPVKDKG
jgi:hypothetical protein